MTENTRRHMVGFGEPKAGVVQDRFASLANRLLVYVGDHQMADQLARIGDGLVVHGRAGFAAARRLENVENLAIDCEHYRGDRGNPPALELFPQSHEQSVRDQFAAGATFLLSPARFPLDKSARGVVQTLEDGARFIEEASRLAPELPAFVTLVVRFDELVDRRWVDPVRRFGLPVATVFAAYGDPLGSRDAVGGARELIAAARDSFILRCDFSVVGLIASGATAGALGASSAVRHLWLPSKKRRNAKPSRAIFVPAAAAWFKIGFIENAMADPDLDFMFRCSCSVCGPNGDVRQLVAPGVSPEYQELHSMAAALELGRSVLNSPNPQATWRQVCAEAQNAYARLAELQISGPKEPAMLEAWLQV